MPEIAPEKLKSILHEDGTLRDGGEAVIEEIISNPRTDDVTVAYIAQRTYNSRLIELILGDKARVLRSPDIIEALGNNPSANRSALDKALAMLCAYLKAKGLIPNPAAESSDDATADEAQAEESDIASLSGVVKESFLDNIPTSADFIVENGGGDAPGSKKPINFLYRIKRMTVPERIKLAMMGNADARKILIRDQNRIVAASVLRNPRLPDSEIVLIAQIKSVGEDVLREIAAVRKWTKIYLVKVALVNNPKTPSDATLGLLRHLRDRELNLLTRNREIPGVILSAARKIAKDRKEQKN
ncbi:MAG: hypothetical protein ACT4NX_08815 [Deltaproteobacteria bacterium]